MTESQKRVFSVALCAGLAALLLSCGGTGSAPIGGFSNLGQVSVSITPASMTVNTGTVQSFTATVNNSGVQTVQWQVCQAGICYPGGQGSLGLIDSSGNYTAPEFVPNPPNIIINAIANADNTKSGNANVTIAGTLLPATVTMSPTVAYLQVGMQMNIAGGVTGPADTSVIWQVNGVANGNATVGTIVPGPNTAIYTAPAKVPSASVVIQAVSHAEPTHAASCNVTISTGPPSQPTVTVTPVVATVAGASSMNFTASVIGLPANAAASVTWEVNGITGGDTTFGTVGANTATVGQYTAPPTLPVPPESNVVQLTAISNSQPSASSKALVTIAPPPANSIGVQVTGQTSVVVETTATYTARLTNTTNSGVEWQVNGITGGNSTYGTIAPDPVIPEQGDYIAPLNVPPDPAVVIGARPNANPNVNGTVAVSILPFELTVTVSCLPTSCVGGTENLGINQQQQFGVQITGDDQNANWFVCTKAGTKNSPPSGCTQGGNSTYGTISPDTGADFVTYTAPASVPSPQTVIIEAVSEKNPADFGVATVTISLSAVSVQISPPGPLQVPVTLLGGPFFANVIGSSDPTVSWYVNGIQNGNSTVGTMSPDTQQLGYEDYFAPANVPNPATVTITAVPEAAPNVTSNKVQVTVIPPQNQVTIQITTNPGELLPGHSEPIDAQVFNSSDQIVNWTLTPTNGGVCTDPNPPTPCGTILPAQTNNAPTTYTAPTNPPGDPYQVTIIATADAEPHPQAHAVVTVTQNATASISIVPGELVVQAGSTNFTTFYAQVTNADPSISVDWTLGCNSLSPGSENPCGPPIGHYKDGSGPGCADYPGGGFDDPLCHTGGFLVDANEQWTYTPPTILGSTYTANNCSKDQTNGWVEITATIAPIPNNCSPTSCTATMCIEITPP
jgi:hypothetical protein